MVFSSITFLCLFMPVVVLLHTYLKSTKARNLVLLISSLIFYAWGEPVYILIMLGVTAINYFCAAGIARAKRRSRKRLLLTTGLVAGLLPLIYFKYSAFLINTVLSLFTSCRLSQPTLPIGISFYTFQLITYTVDVYRKKANVQKSYWGLLLYVCLFPQLIAGPIVRYSDVAKSISSRKVTSSGVVYGFSRFALGLAKKVILANHCGEILESLPAAAEMTFASAWLSAVLYLLQLYFDFAGYSDMAIGLGRMFGFRFLENFDAPFISRSISEFWRRWHISLGSFFREYVYIPLGGNRVSRGRWIFNMLVVWGLTGIWHGANWNFMCWGIYFGVFIVLERTLLKGFCEKAPAALQHVLTILVFVTGFVLFSNEGIAPMFSQLKAMYLPFLGSGWSDASAVYVFKDNLVFIVLCLICSLPLRKYAEQKLEARKAAGNSVRVLETARFTLSCALVILSIVFLVGQSYNPFLYFRF